MLHACVKKFDVTGNLEIFWELNRAYVILVSNCCGTLGNCAMTLSTKTHFRRAIIFLKNVKLIKIKL